MQIVPAVTELLVAQFMWLDYDNPAKPIYLYINSPGTQVSIGFCCFKYPYFSSFLKFFIGKIILIRSETLNHIRYQNLYI